MSTETQKTILIVEDEIVIREAIADVLRLKGYIPTEAIDGKEGVEKALEGHPDLILLDLIMPVMDGMTAFKKIREDAWGAQVPVIILTNQSASSEELVEEIVTYKPAFYLVKSDWKIHDVVDKVTEVLNKT